MTILFVSASIDHSSANIELNMLNYSKTKLLHQDMMLMSSAKNFFIRLIQIQKETFIDICRPFENKYSEIKLIFKEICK